MSITIARNIARAHGGEVTASSPGPGHGATFILTLPLRTSTPASPVPVQAARAARCGTPVGSGSSSTSCGRRATATLPAPDDKDSGPAGPPRRTVPPGRPDAHGARGGPWHTEDVGLYAGRTLPRAINLALRGGEFAGPRARVAAGLDGEVLEIGFGSGLNIPHYPAGLKRVQAVDPRHRGPQAGRQEAAACAVPIEYAGSDATALPVPDESVDHVLSTWTLCTIPDAMQSPGPRSAGC